MKKIEQLRLENEVLKKQIEYLLLRRKQQRSLSKLERGYDCRKERAMVDEIYMDHEKIKNYSILCSMESELRMRMVRNHVTQINRFRRENVGFWPYILELQM
jgi:hypothetical protein